MVKVDFEPKWFMVVLFTLVGAFLGGLAVFIWLFNGNPIVGFQKIHSSKQFKFINPLLAVDTFEKKEFFEDKSLEGRINKIITRQKNEGNIKEGGAYFRDLESGRWMDAGQNATFSPGKLLKTPIMIAYFKEAEENPSILNETLTYTETEESTSLVGQLASPSVNLVEGQQYTVEELIRAMMIDNSDNAAFVLFDTINTADLNDVFADLGINFEEDKETQDFITLKQLALFFRVLYNATYLNRTFSEKALTLLGTPPHEDGMARGIPQGIQIADSFKSQLFEENGKNNIESHVCGIIYLPDHPYLLCLFGIGANLEATDNNFQEISRLVYNDMRTIYKIK